VGAKRSIDAPHIFKARGVDSLSGWGAVNEPTREIVVGAPLASSKYDSGDSLSIQPLATGINL